VDLNTYLGSEPAVSVSGRGKALKRKIIQYVKTPLFADACGLLKRGGWRGRAFTILREPIGRIQSLFW
jgi:hypothetical protein